ncbi:MAG: transposase [Deltaproteobacteria bacterium]|nr:transposase [Deltaproteobacteria bacterium]
MRGCPGPRRRRERSAPIFNKLLEWVESIKDDEPPSLRFGRSLKYFSNQQVPLCQFLTDGRVPIDNGIVERLHVRAALTRKNLSTRPDRGAGPSRHLVISSSRHLVISSLRCGRSVGPSSNWALRSLGPGCHHVNVDPSIRLLSMRPV